MVLIAKKASSKKKLKLRKSEVGKIFGVPCGKCQVEQIEINCLCCQEVPTLNDKTEIQECVLISRFLVKSVITAINNKTSAHFYLIALVISLNYSLKLLTVFHMFFLACLSLISFFI